MKKTRLTGAAALTALLIAAGLGIAGPASAAERDGALAELAGLNPGMSEAQLLTEAESIAASLGTSAERVLEMQLAEARDSAAAAARTAPGGNPALQRAMNIGTITLGSAQNKGDIFISPANTLVVEHGHSGLYTSRTMIIEAPGPGVASRIVPAAQVKVKRGAVKQYVVTSQANRDRAANYAFDNMQDRPYNVNFAFNRKVPAASYNCSQLVWGAYKATVGLDLDANRGLGVYPYDIQRSPSTVTYVTL